MSEENYHITKVTPENIHEVAKLLNGDVYAPAHDDKSTAIIVNGSIVYLGSYIVSIDDTYLVLASPYLECLQDTEGMLMKRKDFFLYERWVGFGGKLPDSSEI